QRLLLTYPTEKDLLASQTEHRAMLQNTIKSTQANMKSQLDSLAALLDQAAGYAERGDAVPASLQDRVTAQRAVVRKQRDWVDHKKAELATFESDAKAQLLHYRSLRQH
ncbi:MAG: hypothetical protein L0H70_06495, partial [Xanthomonadales bacterium]|nr:hypothetical protein [Xanthomonadales bacterium]